MFFFNWFWGFQNWLSNMIKDTYYCKETTDCLCCELFIELPKMSASDTPNQPVRRGKELDDSLWSFKTLEN